MSDPTTYEETVAGAKILASIAARSSHTIPNSLTRDNLRRLIEELRHV